MSNSYCKLIWTRCWSLRTSEKIWVTPGVVPYVISNDITVGLPPGVLVLLAVLVVRFNIVRNDVSD